MSLINDRLREERKRLKKNQKEFAAMLDMAERTYWDRESGAAVPDADFLAKLREFGVDVWYIITGEHMSTGTAAVKSPAGYAAHTIQSLKLSETDADMVVKLAKRLSVD